MCTIPTNYTEAMTQRTLNTGFSIMRKEFDSLVENNTFEVQKAPGDKNIVSSR